MNNVQPDSVIMLYTNVELDNTYDHTFYYANPSELEYHWDGTGSKHEDILATITNNMYQRSGNNSIRVKVNRMKIGSNATSIYNCNYIRFKNTSYENKWFYAFVTAVNYINDATAELVYEIDELTTWYFEYQLGSCFVEREHIADDALGNNLVPENLETGEYITDDFGFYGIELALVLVISDSFNSSMIPASDIGIATIEGLPTSEKMYYMPYYYLPDEQSTLYQRATNNELNLFYSRFIEPYYTSVAKSESLMGLFLYPLSLLDGTQLEAQSGETLPRYQITSNTQSVNTFSVQIPTDANSVRMVGSYKPFNNKCLTYPYNFCYITNFTGDAKAYPFEFFAGNHTATFNVRGYVGDRPSSFCAPTNYKGSYLNVEERVSINQYPNIAIVTDAYREWLNQHALSLGFGAVTGVLNGGIRTMIGGITRAKGAVDIVESIGEIVSSVYEHSIMPNNVNGAGGANAIMASLYLNYWSTIKHVTPQMCKVIDDYFSMYGYATHLVKVPNRRVRKRWTFTKTRGCVIHGNVPNNSMKKIAEIYDKGITHWVVNEKGNVGNYYQSYDEPDTLNSVIAVG